jgi:hypothetical protein
VLEINESYKGFTPPSWFRPTVERLLSSLPSEQLVNLRSIVLTDSVSIGRGKTRRVSGRKYDRNACRGFYYQAWRGRPAWIQLVADNIVAGCPAFLLHLQLFRDHQVAQTLYHEVGHHLQKTIGSTVRGEEEVAEYWRDRLVKMHFQHRYRYLRPVVLVLKTPVQFLQQFVSGNTKPKGGR